MNNETQVKIALENSDNKFVTALDLVKVSGLNLRYLPEEMRDNAEIVLLAVTNFYSALHYASDDKKNNRKIVLAAISQKNWNNNSFGMHHMN